MPPPAFSPKNSSRAILDASFFFGEYPVSGEIFTTPTVIDELKDIRSIGNFEKWSAQGLRVQSPGDENRKRVTATARLTKDSPVISDTDCDLLALALDLGAALYTDDFAIQNIAITLGIPTVSLIQRKARWIHWKFRCSGCGRYSETTGECPVCGAEIKRKLK
jgi:endoribonuclease Nob1